MAPVGWLNKGGSHDKKSHIFSWRLRKMTTLSVFWEGTANTLQPPTTQIGLFYMAARGCNLSQGGQIEESRSASAPTVLGTAQNLVFRSHINFHAG